MIPSCAVIQIASGRSIPGTFHGIEGKRLLVDATKAVSTSTPVSVRYEDALFLGEVVTCAAGVSENWKLEIKVEQILTGLQSLMALRASLLSEGVPLAPALAR